MSSSMAMKSYIHTDASNVYFLVEWLPLGTPLGFFVGLTLTGALCAAERVLTKVLDQSSLELYQWQEDQLLEAQEQMAAEFSTAALERGDPRRRRSNSGGSKRQEQQQQQGHHQDSGSFLGGHSSSGSSGGSGGLIRGSTSVTRLQRLQQRQMQRLLVKKTLLYFCVNALRLGYMLLAMSLHLGVLIVIACSLTGTQLLLDYMGLRRSQQSSLEGYGRIGSSMELDHNVTRSSMRHVDRSDESVDDDDDDEEADTDTSEIRRQKQHATTPRHHERASRHQRRPQSAASMALHISRSHDCA